MNKIWRSTCITKAGLPPASHFLLLVQKESNQRKAPPPHRFFREKRAEKVPKLIAKVGRGQNSRAIKIYFVVKVAAPAQTVAHDIPRLFQ
jgi:hypothetical protein